MWHGLCEHGNDQTSSLEPQSQDLQQSLPKQSLNAAQVKVKTQAAEYQLIKPAAAYKDIFGHMLEQCEIACQVRTVSSPFRGGLASPHDCK